MNKTGFKADDFAVVRFPVLQSDVLTDLATADAEALAVRVRSYLTDPYVREALYLASPPLYAKICAWEAGEGSFNDIPQTIARYLLRMAYRATPFGTFSAVASCTISGGDTRIEIPQRERLRRLAQLDGSALSRLALHCSADGEARAALRYAPNDTIFVSGDVVVFTAYQRNKRGRRVYRRVEVEHGPHVDAVIEIARDGARIDEIVSALVERFPDEATSEEARQYVLDMVETQLLCCDALVDITDESGLGPLLEELPRDSALRAEVAAIADTVAGLCGTVPLEPPGPYAALTERLAGLRVRADKELPTKVDLYAAEGPDMVLSAQTATGVERVVNSLAVLSKRKNKLADFARIFSERYGEAEMPLALVADQLESLGFSDRDASLPAISRMVRFEPKPAAHDGRAAIVDQILALAVEQMDRRYVDVTALVDDTRNVALPGVQDATVVAWFSLWQADAGGEPVIEVRSVGAQDPGRVMGRFAHGLPAVARYLRESARNARYPVAEIVHQPEDRLGNISARPMLSDYEIRLRGGEPKSARRLALDDLTVCVVRERVVVRSKSLGGPIDLRMSNAHAYDRQGNLPLYRFLNHISNQDYAADLPGLRKRLPKAEYVPGLKYRGIVVAKPSWLISAREIARLKKLPRANARAEFQALCKTRGIPDWVALMQGDNVIPYRLDNDWMADDLLKLAFKSGEALLTEVFVEGMRPFLRSQKGAHFHELQVALRAGSALPAPVANAPAGHETAVKPLWSEWAYFKLYAPPHLQDAVLAELKPAIDRLLAASKIDGVFFVRYRDEQGAHLRLRFMVSAGGAVEQVLPALRPLLESLSRRGLAQHVCMAPYVRETARYGGERRSALCERIFCVDSRLLLDALPLLDANELRSWRDAAAAIDCMLVSFGLSGLSQRLAFARRAAADFAAEMRFESEERKRIGKIYSGSPPLAVVEDGVPKREDIRSAEIFAQGVPGIAELWRMIIESPEPLSEERMYGLRWSLIHMRLNRMFNQDQRLQEAVVWELLKRSYASALSRRPSPVPAEEAARADTGADAGADAGA